MTELGPGKSTTCTVAAYPLTQADVDEGRITNTATATAPGPNATTVTAVDSLTTLLEGTSSVSLDKQIVRVGDTAQTVTDTDGNGTDLGDTIRYRFTVKNTGATTLQPVTITDPRLHLSAAVCAASLAPGAEASCEFEPYRLEQQHVDDNSVTNTATANGSTILGTAATPGSDTVTAAYDPPVAPATFVLDKVAGQVDDANGNGRQDAGDTVPYTFNVTNTGPLTIHGLRISDPMLGAAFDCGTASIAPGQTATCTAPAPYRLTQVDLDRGYVDNTATVTGLDPKNRPLAP